MSQMTTLLRRELWENRAITVAPAVIGGLLLLIALLALGGAISIQVGDAPFDLADAVRRWPPEQTGPMLQVGLISLGVFFNSVMIFVIAFYLLDSLYADRKDRSILFWKSLPVSDTTVVLSKLATAALVIPAVTLAVFLLTAVVLWLIGGGAAAAAGNTTVLASGPGVILSTAVAFLYALLVQSLWYLPLFGWLLLASAWAKRGVLWWAARLPALARCGSHDPGARRDGRGLRDEAARKRPRNDRSGAPADGPRALGRAGRRGRVPRRGDLAAAVPGRDLSPGPARAPDPSIGKDDREHRAS